MSDHSVKTYVEHIIKQMGKVIKGKDEQIRIILAAWFAGGHVLLEDVPGTGKTVLAKTLAKCFDVPFDRVQFTPDLLPSDVIGVTVIDPQTKEFRFHKGPIFTTIFLADEINRATPRAQSGLLECMAEKQITADGKRYELDDLFFVLATQNPIEHHGTFPLPHAQLDRFSIKISLGHPQRQQEIELITQRFHSDPLFDLRPVAKVEDVKKIKALVGNIKVDQKVLGYVMDIIQATRAHPHLAIGAAPRATLALVKLAQSYALTQGMDYVSPSLIRELAPVCLNHRLELKTQSLYEGLSAALVMEKILSSIRPPIS